MSGSDGSDKPDKGRRRKRAAIETAQPAKPSAPEGATGVPKYLTERFNMSPAGLERVFGEDKDGNVRPSLWLCAPFTIEAETRDEVGDGWGLCLAWRDRDNRSHRQAFPRTLFAGDCTELRGRLADGGLSLNGAPFARQALAEYFNIASSPHRARSTVRLGWHWIGDKPLFLLHDATYGDAPEAVVLQTPDREPSPFGVAGDLAEWRQEIGLRCGSNSRLLLAASCGFAAPLLSLLNQPGVGINLRGASQTGKSTLLRVAASVCGGTAKDGAAGYLRGWRATLNGLEGIAAASNDCLLPLDELGQLDPKEVADVAYMLANGVGKTRGARSGGARAAARWRLLFLSTGETGLADRIGETGKHMHAGQEVRFVDIPADAGAGMGVFEEIHGEASPGDFARLLATLTARLYGAPLRAFLAKLVHDMRLGSAVYLDRLRERLAKIVTDFLAGRSGAGGQVRSIAGCFGIVGLAGELATEAMITPWRAGEAAQAAHTCLLAYLGERGTLGAREDAQAAAQLRAFLSRHGEGRFVPWSDQQPIVTGRATDPDAEGLPPADPLAPVERFRTQQRAGWRRWVKRSDGTMAWRYYVTSEGMAEAMTGLAPREAIKTLVSLGLVAASTASTDMLRGVVACLYSVPGHGKVRLYQIADDALGWERPVE